MIDMRYKSREILENHYSIPPEEYISGNNKIEYNFKFLPLWKFHEMSNVYLLLTRHGETLENQRHVLQGQLPGTLSDLGKQQAERLAEKLHSEPLDAIVCSDLARSYDTACAVARTHKLIPRQTPLLREMDWGIYTGETLADVDWHHLPPSVESVEQLYQRAVRFINYLKEEFPGKRVLAVGHGAFNRAILTFLEGKPPFEMLEKPIMQNTEIITWHLK